ncbi:MAG: LacI family DNA-binding transcriptional regulator [Fimbriimonadaceae bacterium]|nr:LacI family DNA-binding transcriptional regulator [Fimbriimonadaceae bacterium]
MATASSALNGRRGSIRMAEATRQRIVAAAKELGYVPNPIAKSLATGKTRTLGLVLPYADAFIDQNPFCTHVMHGVFQAAIADKYNLMLYTAWADHHEPPIGFGQHADGLILVLPPLDEPLIAHCREREVPCVAVVADPRIGVPTVNSDDREGGYLGTKHLLDLGHRRIGLLGGAREVSTSEPRRAGYLRALADSGIAPDPRLMASAGFDARFGHAAMLELLSLPLRLRPTAVFAVNDLCANGAMLAIREAGLRVPEDIAVVGYDDTEFCDTTRPTLTSVRMSVDELGSTAVRRLVRRINGQDEQDGEVVLPVSLTIRNSCGARAASLDRERRRSPLESTR